MGLSGTTCKRCGKKYHVCSSCGVETFYFEYCSSKCLFDDGYVICDKCDCGGYAEYCESEEDCPGYRLAKKDEPQSKTFDEMLSDMRKSKSIKSKPIERKLK